MNKLFRDYKYLIMFDLASKKTGICVWDLELKKPYLIDKIETIDKILREKSLYDQLESFFTQLNIPYDDIIVSKEAMPIQVHGGSSTIQTFVALARSHAILDLFLNQNGIAVYDSVGVYPISTHSYLRKLKELPKEHKITKEDIISYVQETFQVLDLTPDEADAVFLAQTLVEVKYQKDVKENLKEAKKELKTLSQQKMTLKREQRMKELEQKISVLLEEVK